ncbi:MAG: NAD(P)/FAD-dependent oxidoreductase [Chloroflexota bacterium]
MVVGAGPAGLVAAKTAGENGFKVALLERKQDLTLMDRACGATLDSANEYLHHELYICNVRDKRLCFPAHGFSVKYDGPWRDLYASHLYSPNGNLIEMGVVEQQKRKGSDGKVTAILDKEILLRCLLEEARACSVEVFPGINVDKVTTTGDGVTVGGSGQSFFGRYLIAADGINSRIAKIMGFNENRTYYCQFRGIAYHMTGVALPEPEACVNVTGFVKEGPAQMFVHQRAITGEYIFIVATLHPEVDLKAAADYFMKEAFCAPWFKNTRILKTFSANANCYSHIDEPGKGPVLITGDVGATQELEITGAIISGWKSGHAVSLALQEEKLGLEVTATSSYIDWWKKAYADYYSSDAYMKVWALPFILTEPELIDYLFGLVREPLPACFNPYTMAKNMGRALRKAMPTAEKERPELFQKLNKMRLPFTEIIADVTRISKPV